MEIINPKIQEAWWTPKEVGEPKEAWWTPKEHDSKKQITYKFEKKKKAGRGGSARIVKSQRGDTTDFHQKQYKLDDSAQIF